MKKLHSFAFYALVAPVITLGGSSVLAEQSGEEGAMQPTPKVMQGDKNKSHAGQYESSVMQNRGYIASTPPKGIHASKLIGAEVKTTGAENVGDVSDLIIDENGQVIAVVIGIGGFLGMGEKNIAIGWNHVTRAGSTIEKGLRIDVSRKELQSAPKFETSK